MVFIRGFDPLAESGQIIADARLFGWGDKQLREEIQEALERAMDVAYQEGADS